MSTECKQAPHPHWSVELSRLGACSEAIEYAETYETLEQAWAECRRGDWMLWLAGKTSGDSTSASRKRVVLAACACARLALKRVKVEEERPRIAIETAERWARGDAELSEVRHAAAAADAADAADAAYAAYAAYAADAADAAYVADAAAAYAAYVAYVAAYAAAYAAAADARKNTLAACADLVREHYPTPPEFPR